MSLFIKCPCGAHVQTYPISVIEGGKISTPLTRCKKCGRTYAATNTPTSMGNKVTFEEIPKGNRSPQEAKQLLHG